MEASHQSFESFRRAHSLSLREMGRVLGCGKSTVSRLCAGTAGNYLTERRADVESRLRAFLAGRKLSPQGVTQALNSLLLTEVPDMAIQRRELTQSAQRFFGFTADPFSLDLLSSEQYYVSPELQKTINRAKRAVEQRRFMALIGGVGCGKTALRHHLMKHYSDEAKAKVKVRFVWIETADFEQLTFAELVWLILSELDVKPAQMRIARMRQLAQTLSAQSATGTRIVLAIEEAHRLSDKALSLLKMFWEKGEVSADEQAIYNRFLGVMLFGQTRLEERLKAHQFQEVVERLQIEKMPDFGKQAQGYLKHRLEAVGGDLEKLFDDAAIKHLAKRAMTPLALGNLANDALLKAYALKENRVVEGMLVNDFEPQIKAMKARA